MSSSSRKAGRRRVLVLGSQTFLSDGPRVGIQIIAEGLSQRGQEVHYVSSPSSPADALSPSRRRRFRRSWLSNADGMPFQVNENLFEYVPRAPFPINRRFWLTTRQLTLYPLLLPQRLIADPFDLCMHDTSPTHLFLDSVKADLTILRLNDHPEGFSFHVPACVTERLLKRLQENRYAEIWPVSASLKAYAEQFGCNVPSIILPNGVDLNRFQMTTNQVRRPRSAVFVGAIERWVDLGLLDETAKRLPDWQIDLYGPWPNRTTLSSPNLRYRGVISFDEIPSLLAGYTVGLIPFKDDKLIRVMDMPLKFFEYLASGLGIAATDVGGLKAGMGEWAAFGTTPESFSAALAAAADVAGTRRYERRAFLAQYSWDAVLERIMERLEGLWAR